MRKMGLSRGVFILPSIFTTANMFFGFFSIVRSLAGDHVTAAWAIFASCIFDMTDGRVARMTKTQSEFGKEYDSLVDLASFGLAPALLMYTWTLSRFHSFGWIFSFIYFSCAALRLARFNVQTNTVEKKRFCGLPTPAAACLLASLVIFYQNFFGSVPFKSVFAVVLMPVLALLMVSNIPYRNFKENDIKRTNSFYVLIAAAVVIGLIALKPDVVLFLVCLTYAASGPMGEILFPQKKAAQTVQTTQRRFAVVELQRKGADHESL